MFKNPDSIMRKVLFVVWENRKIEVDYPQLYETFRGVYTKRQIKNAVAGLKTYNLVVTRKERWKKAYISLCKSRIKNTERLLQEAKLL